MNTEDKIVKKLINIVAKERIEVQKQFYHNNLATVRRTVTDSRILYHFDRSDFGVEPESLIKEYRDYLTNPQKPIFISLSKAKKKSIVNFLLKEKIEQPYLGLIIDSTLYDNYSVSHTHDILKYCSESKDLNYSKKVALHFIDNYRDKTSDSLSSFSLPEELNSLTKFSYTKDDYSTLKHFLNFHKENIKTASYTNEPAFINFLKKSINPHDWYQFEEYLPGKITATAKNKELFEENNYPVFNLGINHDNIKIKYPFISYDKDIKEMMQKIIINLHEHGEQIGISSAFSSGVYKDNPNSTYIHFISNSEKPCNSIFIKKMFSNSIDLYTQEFKTNNSVHDEFLNSVFSFTLLEAQLSSDLVPRNSDIKVKKI